MRSKTEDAVIVRAAELTDLPFLWDMLWEAAAVDDGMRSLGKDHALAVPEIRRYLDGWGRAGDAGLIALDDSGQSIGAVWLRLFPVDGAGYGFVAADVPELSIGVSAESRGRGVGGALLDAVLDTARERGLRAVSLAVNRRNPALVLYERNGFRDAGVSAPSDTGLTMIVLL